MRARSRSAAGTAPERRYGSCTTSSAPVRNSRLNHGLFRRSIENRFLTTFYGVLAPDGALTFTNGGHNAPVLVSASGVRRLETGGMVLGLFEQSTFDEETVTLSPGDF